MIGPIPGFSTRIVWFAAIALGVQPLVRTPGDKGADLVRELIRDGRFARAAESARAELDELGPCAPERIELECLCAEGLRRGDGRLAPSTLALAEDAAALAAELYGADDARTAEPLLQLGALRCIRREWPGAKHALERALGLFREASAGKDPTQALALCYVAIVTLSADGDGDRALAQLDEADRLLDDLAPGDSPDRAWILDMRGNVLVAIGRTEEALAAVACAAEVRRNTQRGDHPMLASTLRNLGSIQERQGRLADARASFQEVLALLESGTEISWALADVRNRLGWLCRDLGDAEQAQAFVTEALADLRSRGLHDSARYASSLDLLARLAWERADLDLARGYAEQGLSILERVPDADPVERGQALLLGAELRARDGEFDCAGELLSQARAIELGGGRMAWSAKCDEVEAKLACLSGDLGRARELYLGLTGTRDGARPGELWASSEVHEGLAHVAFLGGDLDLALSESLQAGGRASDEWSRAAPGLEEMSAIGFEEGPVLKFLGVAASAAARLDRTDAAERVWDGLLHSSDRVYRECAERLELVRSAATPGLAAAGARLAEARLRLAGLYVQSRRSGDPVSFESAIEGARADREAAERDLAREAGVSAGSKDHSPDIGTLRRMLEPRTALVRFCVATRPVSDSTRGASALEIESCYDAFVLDARESTPRILELGSKKAIDRLVHRLREAIRRNVGAKAYVAIAAELRRRILDPILSLIPDANLVLLVPEGELHIVPFTALCSDSGQYLAENGPVVHILASETDLLPSSGPEREGAGLLALGDPDYATAPDAAEDRAPLDSGELVAVAGVTRSAPALVAWPALHETRAEIEAVAASWKNGPCAGERVDLLQGLSASERAFRRSASGHRVIHIATHGYYEAESMASNTGRPRGVPPVSAWEIAPAAALRRSQLPLLRSGLVFAGASASTSATPPENDGILTTEEVLGLDLSGVEWVVLSACDTGLGEIRGAAGVLGLRRAFRMAGARTVIASLWPVEDRWAREWMTALYRARFVDRLSTAESVRAASLGVLSKLRTEGLEALPRLWASFVAVGDWR